MPYRKQYRRKPIRRRRQKGGYVKRVARAEARKAISRSEETKEFDDQVGSVGVNYTGTTWNLLYNSVGAAAITQGVASNQYIGTSITPVFLQIRLNVTAADATNLMRIVIVQAIGTFVPTTTLVFQSVTNVRAPLSPYDHDHNSGYRVLHSKIIELDTTTNVQRVYSIFLKKHKMRKITFSDGAGTIETGGIYLLAISDSAAVADPAIQIYSRLSYKDA